MIGLGRWLGNRGDEPSSSINTKHRRSLNSDTVLNMKVEDYYLEGKRRWLRLLDKGGRHHEVPVHHKAEAVNDLYLEKAGMTADLKG